MKNLKINKKLLKKGKFALIVIPIATTILLSGCELSPNGDRAKYSYTNNTTTSYSNLNTTENTKSDELEIVIEKDNLKGLTDEEVYSRIKDAVESVNKSTTSYKRIKKFNLREEEFEKTSTRKIKRHKLNLQ